MRMHVLTFANILFSNPPQSPCSYNYVFEDSQNSFLLLSMFTFVGIQKLFNTNPFMMDSSQLSLLQSYLMSIGFVLCYNYVNQNCLNYWFKEIKRFENCKGHVFYL